MKSCLIDLLNMNTENIKTETEKRGEAFYVSLKFIEHESPFPCQEQSTNEGEQNEVNPAIYLAFIEGKLRSL